ncbi:related to mixed-linked glucanase precursor MLG1 [Pseudozyma flocculosa]|uniref:Related to mixed-linked glucanase MLG1 n=2 Tax=Pseudozyma flocculosa TaxID=84751 RepID=A0A5C3ES30_9BASI|nr:related to mixed-linked glucanase precursor MLG1 [Pseudozyma flocculosa]
MPSLSRTLALSAVTLSSALLAQAATWSRTADIQGNGFFDAFDWFNERDPTNGLVTYQTVDAAKAAKLSYVDDNGAFVMGVSTVPVALEGRPSVRLQSKQSYADGLYVLNVTHVPTGCSSWPAFWTVTENIKSWPVGGEIDILENANDQYAAGLVSAHTQSTCLIDQNIPDAYGQVTYSNCSAYTEANSGCRVEMSNGPAPTWGADLNKAGGGVFAMERSFGSEGQGVKVWYFPNSDPSSLPKDLRAGSTSANSDNFGKPYAHMPISDCHADFGMHKIIFDITLCGDWAANTYAESGCLAKYSACSYQVGYNGSSYSETYWAVDSLRLFTDGGDKANAANSPNTAKPSTVAASSLATSTAKPSSGAAKSNSASSAASASVSTPLTALAGAAALALGLQLLL